MATGSSVGDVEWKIGQPGDLTHCQSMLMATDSSMDDLELQKIGQPGDLNRCQAYDAFKTALNDVRGGYRHFNPDKTGKGLEEFPIDQVLRGAVISVLSIWEHYVLNLLSEAYNHIVHIDSQESTPEESSDDSSSSKVGGAYKELRKIKKEWPDCQKLVQNAIKRRADMSRKPTEVIAFKLLTCARPHLKLLEEHRDHVLRGCSPLLLGDRGIDDTFLSLFSVNKKKGQNVLLSYAIMLTSMQYDFKSSTGETRNIVFTSAKAINDVLRLYYGARCVFSHGIPSRTFNEGAMRNFPNEEELTKGIGFAPAAADLMNLFSRLKRMGRKASFSYLDLVMLYRFFSRLANRLMVAVAIQVHNITPKSPPLWNYPHYFLHGLTVLGDDDSDSVQSQLQDP